jgi:tetratricopeptide (TPR) repeat protein
MNRLQGKDQQAVAAYAHALMLEEQLQERASRRNLLTGVKLVAQRVLTGDKEDADARTLLALVRLESEQGATDRVLAELDAVLRDKPDHSITLLARCRALERKAADADQPAQRPSWDKALAAYQQFLARPGTMPSWQRVEAEHGQKRVLLRLGRTAEARQAHQETDRE